MILNPPGSSPLEDERIIQHIASLNQQQLKAGALPSLKA